jgi:hypothetical protein
LKSLWPTLMFIDKVVLIIFFLEKNKTWSSFSTRKHNSVSFFGWIVFWQNCIVVFYIFFFSGENTRWYLSNNDAHVQTLYRMRSLCRSSIWSYSWIYEYCAGKDWMLYWMQENQTATYFLRLGMILWQISTAISIKCRILAT